MPSHAGPNTLGESNLVFAYDTGDVSNSYIGEPTVNLALFSVISGITFNADYGGTITQTADYVITYKGRPSLKLVSTSQWNIYKHPRPGNYTATSSTVFTFSWKMKWSDGRVPAINNGYIYTDAQYFYPGVIVTAIEDGWYFCQCSTSGTSSPIWLTGFDCSQIGTCYITDWQAEAKSHATPFTPAGNTRSATQGLLPLIGNSTIDLSNVSFDSSAKIVFDGTDDYVNVPYNTSHNLTSQGTISAWINPATLTQGNFAGIVAQCTGGSVNTQAYQLSWRQISNAMYGAICNGSGTYNEIYASLPTVANVWYNIVFTWNVSQLVMYNNGVVIGTTTQTINNQVLSTDLTIGGFTYKGAGGSGEAFNGKIDKVELYNRALTAQEVKQNYQQYKTRFNLS